MAGSQPDDKGTRRSTRRHLNNVLKSSTPCGGGRLCVCVFVRAPRHEHVHVGVMAGIFKCRCDGGTILVPSQKLESACNNEVIIDYVLQRKSCLLLLVSCLFKVQIYLEPCVCRCLSQSSLWVFNTFFLCLQMSQVAYLPFPSNMTFYIQL